MLIRAQDGREFNENDLTGGFSIGFTYWHNTMWIDIIRGGQNKGGHLFHHRDDHIFVTIKNKFTRCLEDGECIFDFQDELRQFEQREREYEK
jgi:hypothetical protein